jgi:hypothetical protein
MKTYTPEIVVEPELYAVNVLFAAELREARTLHEMSPEQRVRFMNAGLKELSKGTRKPRKAVEPEGTAADIPAPAPKIKK